MSDGDLRNLERLAAGGDVEAESRLLLERVRLGALAPEGLRLASYLGHEAARLASPLEEPPTELVAWILELAPWGKDALARTAIAAAWLVEPVYRAQAPGDPRVEELLRAAEGCLLNPSVDSVVRGQGLLSELQERGLSRARFAYAARWALGAALAEGADAVLARDLSWEEGTRLVAQLSSVGADCYLEPATKEPQARHMIFRRGRPPKLILAIKTLREHTGWSLRDAHEALSGRNGALGDAVQAAIHASDELWAEEGLTPERVRAAIQSELIPWALGLGDPIRERVVKRSGPEVLP